MPDRRRLMSPCMRRWPRWRRWWLPAIRRWTAGSLPVPWLPVRWRICTFPVFLPSTRCCRGRFPTWLWWAIPVRWGLCRSCVSAVRLRWSVTVSRCGCWTGLSCRILWMCWRRIWMTLIISIVSGMPLPVLIRRILSVSMCWRMRPLRLCTELVPPTVWLWWPPRKDASDVPLWAIIWAPLSASGLLTVTGLLMWWIPLNGFGFHATWWHSIISFRRIWIS